MKTKLLLVVLVLMIPLVGFDCVNDPIIVALNLQPFNATYNINPGTSKTFAGSVTIDPTTLYDKSYSLTGASVYDIKVQTVGPDLGLCSGVVKITTGFVTDTLFTFSGAWTAFNTAQSLLTSNLITKNPTGVTQLISAVQNKISVTLAGSGTVATAPSQSGCSVIVSAYVQAYGHLGD